MPKKKDATQEKGVSDKDKNLKPDTQEKEIKEEPLTEEEVKVKEEAEAKEKKEKESTLTDRNQQIQDMADRVDEDWKKEVGITEEGKTAEETEEEAKAKVEKEAEAKAKEKKEGETESEYQKRQEDLLETPEELEQEKAALEAKKKEDTVEITVDGVKKKVPKSQVTDAGIRVLQKESAADARLEEAVQLLKEAKGIKEKKKEKKKPDEELADLGVDKKKISELREAIQYGEEEDAATAIEELIRLGRGGKAEIPEGLMTIEQYEEKEKEKTEKQNQDKINELLEKFHLPPSKGGFSDVTDDPYLRAACIAEIDAELEKGTPNNWELYETAGKKVRTWWGNTINENALKEAAEQKAKDELAAKRDKKAKAAGATITGVNAKTETTKKEPKEETVSDIVAEMRKNRGQPV